MSYPENVNISYTKNGFLYQFDAIYDLLIDDWIVSFLVYHVNDNQIYLGEYSYFRKQILRRLESMNDLENKSKIISELDFKYVKIISSYIYQYTSRIRRNKPQNISLFDYSKQMIEKLMELIIQLNISDLNIVKLDQKYTITFHFVWKGIITASYCLYKQSDHDKFFSEF